MLHEVEMSILSVGANAILILLAAAAILGAIKVVVAVVRAAIAQCIAEIVDIWRHLKK